MNETIQETIKAFEKEVENRKYEPLGFTGDALKPWIERLKAAAAQTPDSERIKVVAAGASALAIAVRNYHTMLKRVAAAGGKTLPGSIGLAMILEEGMCNMVTQAAGELIGTDVATIIDEATDALKKATPAPAGNQEGQEGER